MIEEATNFFAKFIGDTHRPIALLIVAIAFLWAVVNRADYLTLGTIGGVLGVLYWGKSAENITNIKNPPATGKVTQ